MKREDYEQQPCSCAECRQAGVSHLFQKRDPRSGVLLHGYPLRRLYDAEAEFWRRLDGLKASKAIQ